MTRKFEDIKGVIRSRKWKDSNAMAKKKDKRTNNNLPITTQKTKDRTTLTPLSYGGELRKGKQFLLH
jgi:hypothetical protein